MRESERIDELAPIIAGIGRVAAGGARAVGSAVKSLAKKKAMEKAEEKVKSQLGAYQKKLAGRNAEAEKVAARNREIRKDVWSDMEEACWKGYEKKGMKTMFGKRYPNCVKKKAKLRETMEHLSEEGLRAWFGNSRSKGGKPGWVQVVSGKPCARQPGQKSTPKCVSSSKRASMSKSERASAQRRKRAADPGQPQKSGAAKPTYVPTDKPKRKSK